MLRYKVLYKVIIVVCALSLLTACSEYDEESFLFSVVDGNITSVLTLIDNGVDVNLRTEVGCTPLMIAVQNNRELISLVLLRSGADVNAANKYGWTALMFAVKGSYIGCIKTMLENGAEVNIKNDGGWTPLIWAAAHGDVEVVKLLLKNGANIDEKDKNGKTAFSHAEANGHNEVVDLLMRKGAALISGGGVIGSMLLNKVKLGKIIIPTELSERKRKKISKRKILENAFMTYASTGSIDGISSMLSKGIRIDTRNDLGETPLMLAIKGNRFMAAKFLVKMGANVNARNIDDVSVLNMARIYNNGSPERTFRYVKLLEKAGAKN